MAKLASSYPKADPIIRPGQNCWRQERAGRLAWLTNSAAYFAALKRALLAARKQVFIVGWDIDSRIRLERREPMDGVPDVLRDLLAHIAQERPELRIRLLIWDFTLLYATDREPLPALTFAWHTPRNVELVLDDEIPLAAAHHCKYVAVDDRVAFVGGIDITEGRWDTAQHLADDADRVDHTSRPYPPYHDIQTVFDGDAAAAVGDLARERWYRATGHRIRPPRDIGSGDPWPDNAVPVARNVQVGLARTIPPMNGALPVREVEKLYSDAIRTARQSIFIENQYFCANTVVDALAARLSEKDSPEVIVVAPERSHGWLEENTMYVRRIDAVRRLEAADRNGRFGIYAPAFNDDAEAMLNDHAKVMTVDDRFARVGSANLNNRSMCLDSELDMAVETAGGLPPAAVASLRNGILAEHLGVDAGAVAAAYREFGSLHRAVEALRDRNARITLVPLRQQITAPEAVQQLAAVADGEIPAGLSTLKLEVVPGELQPEPQPNGNRHVWLAFGGLAALVLLALVWKFLPITGEASREALADWFDAWRSTTLAPVYSTAAFVILAMVGFPVTVLIATNAAIFGPVTGFGVALAGAIASASSGFAVGAVGGRPLVRRISGRRMRTVNRFLRQRGVVSVAMLRVVPVAPFTVVNLVLGASQLRFFDYMVGTFLGMTPGIAVLALLGDRIETLWRNPSPGNVAVAIALLAGWIVLCFITQRVIARWRLHNKNQRTQGS